MVTIEPFEHRHLVGLELQTAQGPDMAALGAKALWQAVAMGPAFTALRVPSPSPLRGFPSPRAGEGEVLACAGLAENQPHHATAWALFGETMGCRDWTVLVASIRGVLDAAAYRRIDMLVRIGFERAHRFAGLLGFEREGLLRAYGAGGEDFAIYARVRGPCSAEATQGKEA